MAKLAIFFLLLSYYFVKCLGTEEALDEPQAPSDPGDHPSLIQEPVEIETWKPVTCYDCHDCPQVQRNTTIKECPYTPKKNKQACVTFAENYRLLHRTHYTRGCASERGTCKKIQKAHERNGFVNLVFCKECYGDKCNSNGATKSSMNLSIAFLVTAISPLLLVKLTV